LPAQFFEQIILDKIKELGFEIVGLEEIGSKIKLFNLFEWK
jgi:hypothetical protein